MKDTAFFVRTPRRLDDLLKLHLTEQERSLLLQLEALQRDGARKNAS